MKSNFLKRFLAAVLTSTMIFGSVVNTSAAEYVEVAGNIETVKFNNYHTATITEKGDLYMWGFNRDGQLGDGTNTAKYTPSKVMSNVKSFEMQEEYCAAITKNGDLYTWGNDFGFTLGNGISAYDNNYKPYKIMSDVVKVAIYSSHNAAIKANGDLYMWGYNTNGQLGNGTTDIQDAPVKVLSDVKDVLLMGGSSCGQYTAAIKNNGDLYMWGKNSEGQLGNGTTTNQLKPVKVLSKVVSVHAETNAAYVAAITQDGSLYMWGENNKGQLGNGSTTGFSEVRPVKILSDVSSIDMYNGHVAALTKNGDLYSWGYNVSGTVGDGTGGLAAGNKVSPVKVLSDVKEFKLTSDNSAALTTDGKLYIWGDNMYGLVGDGTGGFGNELRTYPVLAMENVKAFDIGADNSSALTEDGSLYVWGENTFGQIGNGTVGTKFYTPVKVLEDVCYYDLSDYSWNFHNIAVREDGGLYTWGYNGFGAIGNGTNIKQLTPVKVLGSVKLPDVEIPIKNPDIERIFGQTRYQTSYEIAEKLKSELNIEKFETVIVANGKNFPDALAGSYLASVKNAPILMASEKTAEALQEFIRENLQLGGMIYVLGGTGAVPASILDGMETDYQVNRLEGATRYETNMLILEEAGVTDEEILVCTGKGFADSLSASATGKPILLVNNKELTDEQKAFLEAHTGNQYYIIGGDGAVSEDMEAAVEAYGPVERIYGENRQETSAEVAKMFFEQPEAVVLAYAKNFPDGLCGGPLAYVLNAPLILTTTEKTDTAEKYVHDYEINKGKVLGGESLISNGAVNVIF